MRLSADRNDPGFSPISRDPRVKVLLDGVERRDVVTADEEQRLIVIYARYPDGRPKLAGRDWGTETLYGAVSIVLPDGLQP